MVDRPAEAPEPAAAAPRRLRVRQRLRTPQEAREWRRRIVSYVLVAVSIVLVVNALVGENGYLATIRAGQEEAELNATLQQLREENQQTKEDIRRLRQDPAALEDAARKKLNLSKPGETLIIIKDKAAPKPAPKSK
jgi:cell division protein FtsB